VELRQGIVFASPGGQDLTLDLFLPRERQATMSPAGVYVHGGGWRGGNPRQFWRQAARMAEIGWPGICVSYRFTPAHRFPAQIEDVQAAVRWLRSRAADYGVDSERIAAAGGSAGGHLVALLGTTDAVVGGVSARVQAVAAFNGVFDLSGLNTPNAQSPRHALTGGDPGLMRAASPLLHADAQAAPALLLHGTADPTVPYRQSLAFHERLKELGIRTELFSADGAVHGFFNRPPWFHPTLEAMERFFRAVLEPDRLDR
jgi:acetyl esterase/lipase